MEDKKLHITYRQTRNLADFDAAHNQLISEAIAFAANAYAPYSGFHVSATLLLDNGQVLKGANVENASYPVGICAERTLVAHAVSNYPKNTIVSIAVYVDKDLDAPVPPCGLCRQTLLEVETRQGKPIKVLLVSKTGLIIQFESCADLLPLAFNAGHLES